MRLDVVSGVCLLGEDGKGSSLWEAEVDCVEGDDEVFVVIDLLKGANYAWLTADRPDEVFVGDGVLQAHALLVDPGEMVLVDGQRVVPVEAKPAGRLVSLCETSLCLGECIQALEPRVHLVGILVRTFTWDGSFDHGEAITD